MVACLTALAPGEALVSVLDASGSPSITQRIWMQVPCSRIGADQLTAKFLPVRNHQESKNLNNSDAKRTLVETLSEITIKLSPKEQLMLGISRTLRWLLRISF
jgi:hypothetical protein